MPEGAQWDADTADWFTKTAHDIGLSREQAQRLATAYNERQFETTHNGQKVIGEQLDSLKSKWGDEFDGRVELGLRGIEKILGPEEIGEFKEVMNTTGLGNHPTMLKLAYQVGKIMKADGYIMSDGHGGLMGAAAAQEKIDAINSDMSHPYWDNTNPGHQAAQKEMSELFRVVANGGN